MTRIKNILKAVATAKSALKNTASRAVQAFRKRGPLSGVVASFPDLTSRGLATTARSVMALPGGPVPVVIGSVFMLGLASMAWLTPASTDRVQMRPFVTEYAFDYSTELPPNLVYDDQTLRFGDPIFVNVVQAIDLDVAWSVPRADVSVSGGQMAVTSVLRSEAGWTRVLDRVPVVAINDLKAQSSIRLNFPQALAIAASVDQATGVSRPVTLDVLVETLLDDAMYETAGDVRAVDGYSYAMLTFALDERVVRLVDVPVAPPVTGDPLAGLIPNTGSASSETGDASTQTGRASTATGGASRFTQATNEATQDGRVGVREVVQMIQTDVLEPNYLRVGPLRLAVSTARRNFTLLGLALLAAGLFGVRVLRRIEAYGEVAVIEARYGPVLTPLPAGVNGHGKHAIDVGSFTSLMALARDRDTPLMVDQTHAKDKSAYYLFDGATTYRYVAIGRPLSIADAADFRVAATTSPVAPGNL